MYTEKKQLSLEKMRVISFIFHGILILIFAALLFLFWNIQIINNIHFRSLAIKNIFQEIEIKAPRGIILDRNKTILAGNKLNFSLFFIPDNVKNQKKSINKASFITGISKKIIQARMTKYQNLRQMIRIPIKRNIPLQKVIYMQSRSDEFPEFEIDIEPSRSYPFKKTASHILGYVSEISSEELNQKKDDYYKLGDEIGKNGIENQYENYIRGKKGVRGVNRDSLGRIQKVMSEEKPEIGCSIILTIDIKLQQYIENLFKDLKGTIGVVDLSGGEMLALVSKPNFNPETFSSIMEPREWEALISDPENPLHNKFTQGLYSPGSVFKVVMALTGLNEKIITANTRFFCSGSIWIYNRLFHCWVSSGHGSMQVVDGLKNSCNIFFYNLGKNLDINTIAKYAQLLGIGVQTGIDLPNENNGLFPTPEWKQREMKQKWFPGETISVSIGGGLLQVTPSQILRMISTVALRGKIPQLHLLKKIEKKGETIREFSPQFEEIPLEKKYFEIVIQGLFKAVNEDGTGRAAAVKGFDICGKTGTQQIISKENPHYKTLSKQKKFKPHSWFASFAPRFNPRYAMVVFVEHGGDAGQVAAPLAAKIYRKLFKK
jgi:penicillin-binding protein 2